jgi:hypothetical protein
VTLELAHDRDRGEGRELDVAIGIEPIDRVQQPQARHLGEVVDRLPSSGEAPREVLGERKEHLDEPVACRGIVRQAFEQLTLGLAIGRPGRGRRIAHPVGAGP